MCAENENKIPRMIRRQRHHKSSKHGWPPDQKSERSSGLTDCLGPAPCRTSQLEAGSEGSVSKGVNLPPSQTASPWIKHNLRCVLPLPAAVCRTGIQSSSFWSQLQSKVNRPELLLLRAVLTQYSMLRTCRPGGLVTSSIQEAERGRG